MPCRTLVNDLQGQENVSDLSYSMGRQGGGGWGKGAVKSLLRPSRCTTHRVHRAYARFTTNKRSFHSLASTQLTVSESCSPASDNEGCQTGNQQHADPNRCQHHNSNQQTAIAGRLGHRYVSRAGGGVQVSIVGGRNLSIICGTVM